MAFPQVQISHYHEDRPGIFAVQLPNGRWQDFDLPTLAAEWAHYYMEAHTPATSLADAELAELARLEGLATPAPWFAVADASEYGTVFYLTPQPGTMYGLAGEASDFGSFPEEADAELAAAMRNAQPGLLARLAAAERYNKLVAAVLDERRRQLRAEMTEACGRGAGRFEELNAQLLTLNALEETILEQLTGKEPQGE